MLKKIKQLFKLIIVLLLLCSAVFTVGVLVPEPGFPTVGYTGNSLILDVTVVDTETGTLVADQNVLIRNGQIVAISSDNIRPKDELINIVEGKGKFLIPGLWDMHTQSLKRSPYIHHPLFIANGVTHVRNLSGCLSNDDTYWACTTERKHWTRLAKQGKAISPNYHQHSLTPLNGGSEIPDKFPNYLKSDSERKANALIKFAESKQSDFITVQPKLRHRTYFSLATEAAKTKLTLAGNKPVETSLLEALNTYQRSFDEPWLFAAECSDTINTYRNPNNTGAIFTTSTRSMLVNNQNPVTCSGLMTEMASSQSWWTPSLSQLKISAYSNDKLFLNSDKNKFVPLVVRYGTWKIQNNKMGLSNKKVSHNTHKEFYELIKKQIGLANQAGVKFLAGTNSNHSHVYSGFSLHDELSDLVDSGLSPLQALRTASYNPAQFSNLTNEYGSIRVGKKADLVLLNANPLERITNIKKIDSVLMHQTYYDRKDLDQLLAFSEKQASSWHMNIKLVWDAIKSPLMRQQLKNDYAEIKNKD